MAKAKTLKSLLAVMAVMLLLVAGTFIYFMVKGNTSVSRGEPSCPFRW